MDEMDAEHGTDLSPAKTDMGPTHSPTLCNQWLRPHRELWRQAPSYAKETRDKMYKV